MLMMLFKSLGWLYLAVVYLWTAGALYYDAGQRTVWSWIWVAAWTVLFGATLYYVQPFSLVILVVTAIFATVLTWWLSQKPSHERDWDLNFSQLPEFIIEGDEITVHNVRNTAYRTLEDFDCHYETRKFKYSELQGMDILLLYWGSNLMAHPMVIFDFGNDHHLCFSIEVRYRKDSKFELLAGLYRQNELMYVVSDERDAILRRTKYSVNHDCYLYHWQDSMTMVRELLNEYIEQTNDLVETPRWYNAVTNNCTTSIYRQRNGKVTWDWRILFNGSIDRMFYERKHIYQGMPYDELRAKSWINERANAASLDSFSREVRDGLPGY